MVRARKRLQPQAELPLAALADAGAAPGSADTGTHTRAGVVGATSAAGIASALATVWIAPESNVPVIGASGAIAGVLGAYFILYPRGRILTILPIFIFIQFIEIPAVIYLLFWFAVQLYAGLEQSGREAAMGGVAWWAHVGGFMFGIALGPMLAINRPTRRRRTR